MIVKRVLVHSKFEIGSAFALFAAPSAAVPKTTVFGTLSSLPDYQTFPCRLDGLARYSRKFVDLDDALGLRQ